MIAKEIKLKVAEAIQDDVNKGVVRIDSSFLTEMGIRPGDIVELEGNIFHVWTEVDSLTKAVCNESQEVERIIGFQVNNQN